MHKPPEGQGNCGGWWSPSVEITVRGVFIITDKLICFFYYYKLNTGYKWCTQKTTPSVPAVNLLAQGDITPARPWMKTYRMKTVIIVKACSLSTCSVSYMQCHRLRLQQGKRDGKPKPKPKKTKNRFVVERFVSASLKLPAPESCGLPEHCSPASPLTSSPLGLEQVKGDLSSVEVAFNTVPSTGDRRTCIFMHIYTWGIY